MLIQILGCPIWKTKRTLAVATTALMATIPAIHFKPNWSKIIANGSPTFNKEKLTTPVSTKASETYKMVQTIREYIIARGKSLCGFLHSSAVVLMASKPI